MVEKYGDQGILNEKSPNSVPLSHSKDSLAPGALNLQGTPERGKEARRPYGVLNHVCARCFRHYSCQLISVGDPADGANSHGTCAWCLPLAVREIREFLGEAVDCSSCGHMLPLDGVCGKCGRPHDRRREEEAARASSAASESFGLIPWVSL